MYKGLGLDFLWFSSRLKSESIPRFAGGYSFNLLCVLSAPKHTLTTLKIPPRLTCVLVCDSVSSIERQNIKWVHEKKR